MRYMKCSRLQIKCTKLIRIVLVQQYISNGDAVMAASYENSLEKYHVMSILNTELALGKNGLF